ncbi:hypothetical protein BDV96DRAFT_43294 [Lophiotrema nucula]|uniref:Uncharacterized protein n=1 Tax=Lophiotrema nucula TaxID=690887 RepID=A0A6A5ZBN0_9PLEO|nr:hypothetical protein BDV96DRAFT_43294 [Lophiotrema nucula]
MSELQFAEQPRPMNHRSKHAVAHPSVKLAPMIALSMALLGLDSLRCCIWARSTLTMLTTCVPASSFPAEFVNCSMETYHFRRCRHAGRQLVERVSPQSLSKPPSYCVRCWLVNRSQESLHAKMAAAPCIRLDAVPLSVMATPRCVADLWLTIGRSVRGPT